MNQRLAQVNKRLAVLLQPQQEVQQLRDEQQSLEQKQAAQAQTEAAKAAVRKRLEPEIAADDDELSSLCWKAQEILDRKRQRLDAYNAAGGLGVFNPQFEQEVDALGTLGSATGRLQVTFSFEAGKRLVKSK